MAEQLQADYIVMGAGATGMAFVDTLLDESDASVIMVDDHHQPGGHWNDAYPFVRLHQPSHYYGVASTPLGSMRIDEAGPNKGYFELATGNEVQSYFEQVMRERFLPSGRVRYFPMSQVASFENGQVRFRNTLSGATQTVSVARKLVDTTFYKTTVPSRHRRRFEVADEVACVTPNQLPLAAPNHQRYCILGAGKTAMDVGVWLLSHGAPAESVTWVCPRRSWLLNRAVVQGHPSFFSESIGCFANQLEALAQASDLEDLFERLERCGFLLRIHDDQAPTMFHFAIISHGEIEQLKKIDQLIEDGRVASIAPDALHMASGRRINMAANTLYIDCTASATDFKDNETPPVFSENLIRVQASRVPNACLSAAIAAYVEANYGDDETRNRICPPVPLPDSPASWLRSQLGNLTAQAIMLGEPKLREWVTNCRLDPFGAVIRDADENDPEQAAIVAKMRDFAMPAIANVQKLIAANPDL